MECCSRRPWGGASLSKPGPPAWCAGAAPGGCCPTLSTRTVDTPTGPSFGRAGVLMTVKVVTPQGRLLQLNDHNVPLLEISKYLFLLIYDVLQLSLVYMSKRDDCRSLGTTSLVTNRLLVVLVPKHYCNGSYR